MAVKPKLGLTAWLAILVLGAVVPLLLFAGLALRSVLHSSRALADRGQIDTTRALALAADGAVHEWRAALATLASSMSLQQGRWAEFYEEARGVATRYEGWVVLNPAAGPQQLNTLRPFGAPLPQTAASEMVQAVFREGTPVTDMTFGAVAQRYIISNSIPVFRDGKVIYCLSLNFGPERLTRLLQTQPFPETWVAALNDSQRRVVARSRDAEARVGKPVVEWFAAATRASESGVVTGPMIDGRLGQIAFERLKEVPWVIALAVPVAELQSAAPLWDFTTVGAILALLAVGMAIYIGRQLTGPVRSLARASESLLRGETGFVAPPTGIREMQELEQALVKAAAAARAHAAEREQAAEALRQANEELERRVTERTAALASANAALRAANTDLQEEIVQRRRAEESVQALARFPSENPNPVLRLDSEGRILFANAASAPVLDQWETTVGSAAAAPWPGAVGDALTSNAVATTELVCADRTYAVFIAPVPEAGYANLYMSDITKRKRAEMAVDAARAEAVKEKSRLEAVMHALPVGMCLVDAQGGFVRTNAAFEQVWGGPRPPANTVADYALYQAWWADTGQPVQPEEWASAQAVQHKRHVLGQMLQIQRFDGTRAFVLNGAAPVLDADGAVNGAAIAIQDITELRNTQETLRREREVLRVTLASIGDAVLATDTSGRLTFLNPVAEGLTGWSQDQAVGQPHHSVFRIINEITREPAEDIVARVLLERRGIALANNSLLVTRDGREVPIEDSAAPIRDGSGNVSGVVLVFHDVTEKRRAQVALATERANLEAVFDVVNVGLVLMDSDGAVRRVNNAVSSWSGQDLATPRSAQLGDLVGCSHALEEPAGCGHTPHCGTCAIRSAFEATLRTGESRHAVEAEVALVRKGRPIHLWLEVNTEPLALDGGNGVLLALHDITAHKHAEMALRRSAERLDLLAASASELLASDSPQAVVASLCERVMAFMDCDAFCNFLIDEESRRLHLNACGGLLAAGAQKIEWIDYGQNVCGCAARDGCRIVAEDILHSADSRTDLVKSFGLQAYACHPLLAEGRILGTLSFGTSRRANFTADELSLMEAVSNHVALAIQRLRAKESLRRSEALYRAIGESMDYGVWVCAADGRNTYASPSFLNMVGLTQEQCSDFGWGAVLHPDDADRTIAAWKECVRTQGIWDIEHRFRGVDGQWHDVLARGVPVKDEQGKVISWAGINLDISRLKRAEEALRSLNAELEQRVSERTADLADAVALLQREVAERVAADKATRAERQRLYDVLETLPVYVVLLSEDYHVPFANRFFRERFGESHGRRCYEYLFHRNTPCEDCESYTVLKTGAPHHWGWTGPDGRNYDIYDFPFADTDGSRHILEMGIDVTEQKRAEAALRAAHRELADHADRLRTLATHLTLAEQRERRRLADVLHDELQQVLVATRLRAHMLGSTADPAVRQGAQEIVALMAEALGKTRSLTGELSPPTLQKGDLLPALEWLTRWVGEKNHLTVRIEPPQDPLPSLPEDTAVLLYQAVRECLLNIVKHAQVSEATVTVTAAAPALTITVVDAGVGFDPTRLRVEGGPDGGIGLLGIRERLEWAGGRLEIASAPGHGSRLTLVAPLGQSAPRPAPSAVAAPADADSSGHAARRRRVLVVDDHALVRRGFATLLAGEPDLEVVGEADNGQRAVELARQTAPDVILMDIHMPVMNGIDATRAIHAEFPAIRVIGLSVFDDPEQPEAIRQAGAVAYVRKNDSADALLAAVRGGGASPFDAAQGER